MKNLKWVVSEQKLKEEKYPIFLCTVNSQHVYHYYTNSIFKQAIENFRCVIDGQVLKFLHSQLGLPKTVEKISGVDIALRLGKYFPEMSEERIFILGGSIESNSGARKKLHELYSCEVGGHDGFSIPLFEPSGESPIKEIISTFDPTILIVCLGCPKQEHWIIQNRDWISNLDLKLVYGAGGTVDFLAGRSERAPKWISNSGTEIFYRLYKDKNWNRLHRVLISIYGLLLLLVVGK